MHAAVIIFPGSNCDRDIENALHQVTGKTPSRVWYNDTSLPQNVDLIVIPGGFSFGDYLRSGAIAARAPIMKAVIQAADQGKYVMGVCNGFQILTEAGLLPGTLVRNKNLRFIGKKIAIKVTSNDSVFTSLYQRDHIIQLHIAHQDGNYRTDQVTLEALRDKDQILFQYDGETDNAPNGSMHAIAGIVNTRRNILGMMPHPERSVDPVMGSTDGAVLFRSLCQSFVQ